MLNFIKPKGFFLGIVIGLLGCSIAGYIISQKARFNHFTRFTNYIATSLDYFPTANEMLVTAKHDVDPNKILVLVGGSSIFRGDGQNEDDLWSKKLQEQLGPKFKVLNYGFNGAQFSAFGGVAYRILKEHFPKIIFVSTCTYSESAIDGDKDYRFLFWDAYYKGLFKVNDEEKTVINKLRHYQIFNERDGLEVHLMAYFDSFFYFRSLWNWVGYRHFFTVWNKNVYPKTFYPRRKFPDDVVDNKSLADNMRNNTAAFESQMDAIRRSNYRQYIQKNGKYIETEHKRLVDIYGNLFDLRYRQNTLCFFSTYNKRNLNALPKEDHEAYLKMIDNTREIVRSLGYHEARVYNLMPNDYMDLMHYVASGGEKIAAGLAPKIKTIARKNGYLS